MSLGSTRSRIAPLLVASLLGPGCAKLGAAQGKASAVQSGVKGAGDQAKQGMDETKKNIGLFKKNGAAAAAAAADEDRDRLGALLARVNRPNNDRLDPAAGDKADWKVLSLGGRGGGYARFFINWDEPGVELGLDIHDQNGVNIASAPPRTGSQNGKRVLAKIEHPGIYYAKISSLSGGSTVYTLGCEWEREGPLPQGVKTGEGDAAAQQAQQPPQLPQQQPPQFPQQQPQFPQQQPPQFPQQQPQFGQPQFPQQQPQFGQPQQPQFGQPQQPQFGQQPGQVQPQPIGTAAVMGAPLPPPTDPLHPRARIVQSYRGEDGALVLYLDRGSASNVKPGMSGHVLLGADGDVLLDGGAFKISRVIDATRSIARIPRSGLSTLGAKNNRAVIHLVQWP